MQLLISLVGSSLGFFMVGAACFTQSYSFILFARVFQGLSGFSVGIAKAYIADMTTPTERAAYIGRLGIFYGVAFISGPVVAIAIMLVARAAGAKQQAEWASVFFVAAGVGVCAVVLAAFTLRESKPDVQSRVCTPQNLQKAGRKADDIDEPADASSRDKGADVDTKKEALNDAQEHPELQEQRSNKLVLCLLFVSIFAVTYSLTVLQSMYALLAQYLWGWGPLEVGAALGLFGVIVAVVQGALVKPLTQTCGERVMSTVGMGIMGVCGFFALCTGSGYSRLDLNHSISTGPQRQHKECMGVMDGGEWLAGTEAKGMMVRELGTDGYNSIDATLCAQLCQGLAFTSEQILVGHWNTSTATRMRTQMVDKTPPHCKHFLFAAAADDRDAYCAWLHPDLEGSVVPSLGDAAPVCADGYKAAANLTQFPGAVHSVGPHHVGWIILHFVLIALYIAGWSMATVGIDTLVSFNSTKDTQGWAQGCREASSSLGRATSPLISALLLDYSPRVWGNFSFPFLMGSCLVLACCWMPLIRGAASPPVAEMKIHPIDKEYR